MISVHKSIHSTEALNIVVEPNQSWNTIRRDGPCTELKQAFLFPGIVDVDCILEWSHEITNRYIENTYIHKLVKLN